MSKTSLEARLEVLTREFVGKIVETIRSASFGDVVDYRGGRAAPAGGGRAEVRSGSVGRPKKSAKPAGGRGPSADGRTRQTAEKRAELADRVLDALRQADAPMGVRALSSELGVAADLLAVPLRELRSAGKIAKHGEKRATTYSAR